MNNNLTKWKGGGFGMYSEHHYADYELWTSSSINEIPKEIALRLKRKPTKVNALKILKYLDNEKDTIVIQIWKPKLEVKTLNYRRELKYEYIAVKDIDY